MFEIGYKLCSEEQSPEELIHYAHLAEETGFDFAMISDHYHPWVEKQGQSSFVWAVLGGIAQVTERLKLGTAVTYPTIRIHPAIIAQAAASKSRVPLSNLKAASFLLFQQALNPVADFKFSLPPHYFLAEPGSVIFRCCSASTAAGVMFATAD